MADMGVNEDMQPDKFYFDHALKVFAREQSSQSPVFMFVYLTANHFPWTDVYRPDLTPRAGRRREMRRRSTNTSAARP